MNDTKLIISLKVPQIIKEFIAATNGSAIIRPEKSDRLYMLVKYNLEIGEDTTQECDDENMSTVHIELLDCSGTESLVRQTTRRCNANKKAQRSNQVYIHPDSRSRLSAKGQKKIAQFLTKQFRELFHNFMQAYCMASPDVPQITILYKFMETYNLELTNIKEEALLKSWRRDWRYAYLRSKQRRQITENKTFCPLIY